MQECVDVLVDCKVEKLRSILKLSNERLQNRLLSWVDANENLTNCAYINCIPGVRRKSSNYTIGGETADVSEETE